MKIKEFVVNLDVLRLKDREAETIAEGIPKLLINTIKMTVADTISVSTEIKSVAVNLQRMFSVQGICKPVVNIKF